MFFGWKMLKVHTLLKGLEKIAASADIPMLVCGDFNSVPGRWVATLKYNKLKENHYYFTILLMLAILTSIAVLHMHFLQSVKLIQCIQI